MANENLEEGKRHGVTFDDKAVRLPKMKLDPVWLKRIGILALAALGALFLVSLLKGKHVTPTILSFHGVPRVLRSADLHFTTSPTFDG